MSDTIKPLLAKLVDGRVLTTAEAGDFFAACLRGEPTPAQVAAAARLGLDAELAARGPSLSITVRLPSIRPGRPGCGESGGTGRVVRATQPPPGRSRRPGSSTNRRNSASFRTRTMRLRRSPPGLRP